MTLADGDGPGESGTGGNAAGGDGQTGDEAVWLDLIARFGAPAPDSDEAPPWPDRESLAGTDPVHVTPAVPPPVPEALPGEPPTNPTGLPGLPVLGPGPAMPDQPSASPPRPDQSRPDRAQPDRARPDQAHPSPSGPGPRDYVARPGPADDHFVPPVPPPLPRLDPATKFAWLALFGGPLYLLISTAVGATISGLAAFLAVAAFVGGFIVLVLRMDNGRPPDSGSDDDGAVV
jgi:hypothetical protein